MKKIILFLFLLVILLVSCKTEEVDSNQVLEDIGSLDEEIDSLEGIEEDVELNDIENLDENLDLEGL